MTSGGAVRRWFTPGLIGLHVLGVVAVIVCIVMGLWQAGVYDSRQEHEQADKQTVPRVALADLWGANDPFTRELNQRPVTVEGEFAPAADQIWVTDKVQGDRTGAWLVAPLVVAGGNEALLVVRGWAPAPGDLPDVPAGPVTLEAALQQGESAGGTFDAADRTIGSVRIPALINELPYDLYSGFAISTDEAIAGGLELVPPPLPGDVSWTVGLKNLAYALQWWVFGLFAAFMWWRMSTETMAATREKVA
ncbi:MAG: SURF1 family protein [Aeromicrobium sp.]